MAMGTVWSRAPKRARRPSRTAHWRRIDSRWRPARRVMLSASGSLRRAPSSRRAPCREDRR
jgi:hypothetical protein